MISRFFIDRPIFASVLSIVIVLAGSVSLLSLPIAQYPPIAPPMVQVYASYPGANAKVVADTVAAPIEQQVNGVDKMLYMQSQCTNDGAYTLRLTFSVDADLNIALVQVQNRVQLAMPLLPSQVQKQGVNIKKKNPNTLLAINFISDGRYDDTYMSNYATIQVKDELLRLYGVGDIAYMGERDYSIRAWLDPEQLAARNLTASDVSQAVMDQNKQVVCGLVGQPPAPGGQPFQVVLSALGRLTETGDFGNIVVRAGNGDLESPAPALVRLRDVSRIELGAQQYDQICSLDGQLSVALAVFQQPGTNALQTAEGVYKKMRELKQRFPEGLDYKIAYDTTPFISQSIDEVIHTFRDAVILVAIVVLLFLQNWRSTLIPLIAVPVAIVGTFAAMAVFQFSINNLSLFGLVLAIGIVVDDAIVVVENVERWLGQGLSPRQSAIRAMDEVTGPVVGVALVLSAVFVPCAFISGVVGLFFRQFALTIAISTVLSAFNSLTLSPALAALLLKPHDQSKHRPEVLPRLSIILAGSFATYLLVMPHLRGWMTNEWLDWSVRLLVVGIGAVAGWLIARIVNSGLGWFFHLFNKGFDYSAAGYTWIVGMLLRGTVVGLAVYGGLLFLTYFAFTHWPVGFIPIQDQGYLVLTVQLPDAAGVQRTKEVIDRVDRICRSTPGVKHTMACSGQSFLYYANSPNWGSMFVILEDFEKRRAPELSANGILLTLRNRCAREVMEATVGVFPSPPVPGLGNAGGYKLYIEDRGNLGLDTLQEVNDDFIAAARQPKLPLVLSDFRSQSPQLFLDIDRDKVRALDVSLKDVFDTLQIYMGAMYVNNFNEFGRSWQVNLMADPRFRARIAEVTQLKVRNKQGLMVPLGTVLQVRDTGGPVMVMRYNLYEADALTCIPRPGTSSSEVFQIVHDASAKELPEAMTYEWSEIAFLQIQAGNTAMSLFALGVILVFLVLAALYESWGLPLAVILVVPMCLLCSVAGLAIASLPIDILAQIGLVVLVGLASKNAILIVEFAKQEREAGKDPRQATLEACRLRLRPIMMTSFAFILGVLPLVQAQGAGAEMRRSLGTAVFAGMIGVTIFGIFLTPIFFYAIAGLSETRLFSSPACQRLGRRLIDALSFTTAGLLSALGAERVLTGPWVLAPPHAAHWIDWGWLDSLRRILAQWGVTLPQELLRIHVVQGLAFIGGGFVGALLLAGLRRGLPAWLRERRK